jgi:hypothetical protein
MSGLQDCSQMGFLVLLTMLLLVPSVTMDLLAVQRWLHLPILPVSPPHLFKGLDSAYERICDVCLSQTDLFCLTG